MPATAAALTVPTVPRPVGARPGSDRCHRLVIIDRIELRLLRLPLVRHFETSFGRSYDRLFLLASVSADGATGWGECVAEHHPYYSSETTETAWHVITTFIAPLVLGRAFAHPREVFPALARIRGHQMAKAAVEMAAWDLYARQQQQPLYAVLGGNGQPVASGVSIGIQDTLDELVERVQVEWAAGYQRIKIKVKPGWDVEAVARVRGAFGDIPLMVDANAAYTLNDAAHLARLDPFDLMMIEQPLDYDDVADHAALQRRIRTPVCLDESITSVRLAQQAIDARACAVVNIKPGRLGGFAPSIAVHDLCARAGVPVWHGGMLESGIGRAANLHLSTLPNFRLPGDIAASHRYFQPDLIDPPIDVQPDGTVLVPAEGPGIGVSIDASRVEAATLRRTEIRPS
jgi:O-succinylbenzoate synthase